MFLCNKYWIRTGAVGHKFQPFEKHFPAVWWWSPKVWISLVLLAGGGRVLSEPDHKASLLLCGDCSVWKWLWDVWWAREETPFTTTLLSLWELIIHTEWPHTWMHTHTLIHKQILFVQYTHMNLLHTYCRGLLHTHKHSLWHEHWWADVYTHHTIN